MIKIKNLRVGVAKKEILKGINLNFELGKNYCLLGKNGSGKSTLVSFMMGHPKYNYIDGEINIIDEKGLKTDLLKLNPEDRSRAGLFLSFQNIPEIKGIKLGEYLRIIYNISKTQNNKNGEKNSFNGLSPFLFERFIKKYLVELNISKSFLNRELNVGFSGGEKRKIEILQMKLIGPKYIILDEIDSGLDLDAFKIIAKMLKELSNDTNSLIIITHYFKILDYINVDKVFVMKDGKINSEGDISFIEKIKENGFENL